MALYKRQSEDAFVGIEGSLERNWADIQEFGFNQEAFKPSDLILKIDDITWDMIKHGLLRRHNETVVPASPVRSLVEVEALV